MEFMRKLLRVALWELVVFSLIAGGVGAMAYASVRPASAENVPSVTYNINRIACALEGIQHSLERLEHKQK